MLLQVLLNTFKQSLHPNAVLPVKVNGQSVSQTKIVALLAFFAMSVLMMLVTAAIMIVGGIDNTNAVVIAISSFGNVGPSLSNEVGMVMTWSEMSDLIKWALCLLMLMGRLEIMTVIVLFTRVFWKDN